MPPRGGARKEMCAVCEGSGRQQDLETLYSVVECRYCRGTGFDTNLPLKKGSDGIDWSKIKTKRGGECVFQNLK
tara:strand:+ start:555 stop:776 length:222 start_codon:yes stop_codon:yes gene_type:complete